MRVLVTGGAGFIGGSLIRRLADNPSLDILAMDNLHRGRRENVESGTRFFKADVRDTDALETAMNGVDVVFHLAAQASVMSAAEDAEYTFHANVTGTFNVLQSAKASGVKRVVFASSREVYGDPARVPVAETDAVQPKNSYGVSKAAGESYCRLFRTAGLETVILRLANVYGPGDRDRVIPLFIESALRDHPIALFGGQQVLDFVWIDAVVDAMVKAGFGPWIEEPLNIGSGSGTTVAQLAQRVVELTGSKSDICIEPPRHVEVTRFVADVSRARQMAGLRPPQDPLFGLARVIESVAQHQVVRFSR